MRNTLVVSLLVCGTQAVKLSRYSEKNKMEILAGADGDDWTPANQESIQLSQNGVYIPDPAHPQMNLKNKMEVLGGAANPHEGWRNRDLQMRNQMVGRAGSNLLQSKGIDSTGYIPDPEHPDRDLGNEMEILGGADGDGDEWVPMPTQAALQEQTHLQLQQNGDYIPDPAHPQMNLKNKMEVLGAAAAPHEGWVDHQAMQEEEFSQLNQDDYIPDPAHPQMNVHNHMEVLGAAAAPHEGWVDAQHLQEYLELNQDDYIPDPAHPQMNVHNHMEVLGAAAAPHEGWVNALQESSHIQLDQDDYIPDPAHPQMNVHNHMEVLGAAAAPHEGWVDAQHIQLDQDDDYIPDPANPQRNLKNEMEVLGGAAYPHEHWVPA